MTRNPKNDQINTFSAVRNILGEPAYESEAVLLYNLDCVSAMKALPEEIIDLTVTSPPYNIGKEYEKVLPLDTYLQWSAEWVAEVFRLGKAASSFWLNVGYLKVDGKGLAVPIPYLLWDKTDFFFIQEIVWNYGAGVSCRNRFSPRNEKVLWYVKDPSNYTFNLDRIRDPNVKYPNQKKNGKIKVNPLGKNPSDVWQIPKVTSGRSRSSPERTSHPAQFPELLIERVILGASEAGQTVLDPFMGSGTTAVAALKHGRRVIGFEIDETSVAIAKNRIETFLLKREISEG